MNNGDLMYMPSGLGGVLPCVIVELGDEKTEVRCIHNEFYPMWLLEVKTNELTEVTGTMRDYLAKRANQARKMGNKNAQN